MTQVPPCEDFLSGPCSKCTVASGTRVLTYTREHGRDPFCPRVALVAQHGAVVAREYGKPCVVAIDRVTDRLRDGEIVEVDGAAGTVRRSTGTVPDL